MNKENKQNSYGALTVGIDIGTTTVSAVVYDIDNKIQLEAFSTPHNSYVYSDICSEQSVDIVIGKAEELLYRIFDDYENIVSIGITGQMHGIVYVNEDGRAVSNLINWQDKRADEILNSGKSACQTITELTGEPISTGYGIATHYYNVINGKVPKDAVGFLSIMDFFGMKICKLKKSKMHTSVASSFGFFDVKKGEFKKEKLALLGIDCSFLPDVTDKSIVIGEARGIPVSVGIGDNQASFLGSVRDNDSEILINIGTGAQISAVSDYCSVSGGIEIRPLFEGRYLICGSALCGGFAYSMLESFFRSYATCLGHKDKMQYDTMNQLAREAYEKGEKGLLVDASFCGKRSDPDARGSIKMIDRQNFTPANLVLGVLKGMSNELYELYGEFPKKRTHAVASGGAIRQNDVLKALIEERFNMSVSTDTVREEAATGAALFAALAIEKIKYNNGFSEYLDGGKLL